MKISPLFAALLAAALTVTNALAGRPAVQLVVSKPIQSTTTYELRFDETMIGPDQIGKPSDGPVLVFRPALKGTFVWLSQRSGSFKPEEPPLLSTTYSLAIAPGVKKANGEEFVADFRETIETPRMQMKGWNTTNWYSPSDASAEPKYSILFNVDVDPNTAGRFFMYRNTAGAEVPARVERANPKDHPEQFFPKWRSNDRSLCTWRECFYQDAKAQEKRELNLASAPAENLLWITPTHVLPPGDGWKLVVLAGLPASNDTLRLLEPVLVEIGNVVPFQLLRAAASNDIGDGRQLHLDFSKNLSKEITPQNFQRWIRIEPTVPNLKASVGYRGVVLTGDFELTREYQVVVDRGISSAESFVLADEVRRTVDFKQVPPRIYFEEFATHQLSSGTRRFHFLTVNVPKVKVSARVFTPDSTALALAAWDHYDNPRRRDYRRAYDEPFAKVDLSEMPGQTIWQKEFDSSGEVDAKVEVALDWNEILGANKTGTVLLTAEQVGEPVKDKRPGVQTIVQVTDLGMVWKQSQTDTFIHVFSLSGGKAVAGTIVKTLDAENNVLEEAKVDAGGLARLKTTEKSRWILVQNGTDMHLVDFKDREESLSLRQLGIHTARYLYDEDEDEDETSGPRPVLLFTERPVYKPGETVHLKGILRDWRENQARIPAGAKAKLHVIDAKERAILDRSVTISDLGSFSEDIKLPTGGLGTYTIQLNLDADGAGADPVATHEFEVQEYEPNAFEIKIAPTPRSVGATQFELPITAQYYMGKPLSRAQLTWSLSADDGRFTPEGFGAFAFCNAILDPDLNKSLGRNSHFSDQGKADLDDKGTAKVSTLIPMNPKAPQPREGELICEVTDLDQKTVSQTQEFTIHSSDFYLGIRRMRSFIQEGDALPVDVIAVRTDSTPMPTPVEATVRVTRIEWSNNRIETAGNAYGYRSEPRYELVSTTTAQTRPLVNVDGKWILDPTGQGLPLVAGKPGQYLLEAVSKDAGGRDVVTSTTFDVAGQGETEWQYRNQYQIELVSDKEDYKSGETAKLLVKTPIAGEALVTIERDKVLRSFVTQLSGNAPSVEIPLADSDAPNVFVSVMMLRGAADSPRKFKAPEYRIGYCKLLVTRKDAELNVYVKPDAQSYRPGSAVRVDAQVLDFEGKPVANAEVTLFATDEGVLSLMGYETPDPLAFFNREQALGVTTGLTIPTLLSEDPEERSYANKGYLIGGGGENGADALRKNFIACALWNGSLRTNAEGRVTATFTAPDSLTRYRVMAVVQTARDQFGSAESSFEINKPVMLEPALPRFANVGDKIVLRAVLHNLTDAEGDVAVKLELDRTAEAKETERQVQLPAHGSLAVDFPVEFKDAGSAVWKWTANFTGRDVTYRDSVQTTLNVGYPVPILRAVSSGHTNEAEQNLLAGLNPELFEGTGVVRVSITNSRVLDLRESVEQLLHYPYGCVEQTTSSTLPWVSMRDFRDVLPGLRKTDDQITAAVNHGVDRLLSMQTASGGLSYWPGESKPLFWGSAYGGFGLAMARRAGFAVPQKPFERLCNYLSQELRSTGNDGFDGHYGGGGPSDRCLALYTLALAGKAEPAYHEVLFKKREQLSSENRALLGLAILESNGPGEMVSALLDPKQELRVPDGDRFWSFSRDTALRLLAWCQHDANAPVVGELVEGLLGRRLGGHWVTTQGNCWSLLALGAYFGHVEKPDDSANGSITWQHRQEKFSVGHDTPLQTLQFPIAKGAAADSLKLANPQQRDIYTEVVVEAQPPTLQMPRQDQGYAIRRSYAKIEDDGTLRALTEPRVGDRVLVTLSLDVRRDAYYVAVDDPLPAIFEAVNPVFKSQATLGSEKLGLNWVMSHQELREDRALFFADVITPGEYTIRYLARVRAVGTATAPSAKIEEMYHPERFGLTETQQLTSLPLK